MSCASRSGRKQKRRLSPNAAADREAICEVVDEIEKQSVALDKALSKASRHYTALEDCVRSVLSYGDNAEGFDLRMFKTSAAAWPLRTRSPSIAIAEHFGFGPSHHLEMWPEPYGRDEGKARAFADFRADEGRLARPT